MSVAGRRRYKYTCGTLGRGRWEDGAARTTCGDLNIYVGVVAAAVVYIILMLWVSDGCMVCC